MMEIYREAYENYKSACESYGMEYISFTYFIKNLTNEQIHEYSKQSNFWLGSDYNGIPCRTQTMKPCRFQINEAGFFVLEADSVDRLKNHGSCVDDD